MDDIVGFFAERIARQIREARVAAAQRQLPVAASTPPGPPKPRVTAPPLRLPRADADDIFGTRVEVVPQAGRPAGSNALLAAFAGGRPLLAALVLAEALAPPVALRNEPPHRP